MSKKSKRKRKARIQKMLHKIWERISKNKDKEIQIMAEQTQENLFPITLDIGQSHKEFFLTKKDYKELSRQIECLDNQLKNISGQLTSLIHTSSQDIKKELAEIVKQKTQDEIHQKSEKIKKIQDELATAYREIESRDTQLQEFESLRLNTDNLTKEVARKTEEIAERDEKLKEFNAICQQKEQYESIVAKLERELPLNLYDEYKKLSADFRNRFDSIKDDTLMSFFVTSGSKKTIIDLYKYIETLLRGDMEAESIMRFFNMLFDFCGALHGLERIQETKQYDEDLHIRFTPKGREPINTTLFLGFKDGRMIYKSIVE